MLEELLRYVNNRFERGSVSGSFTISDGVLLVSGAVDGQWVWVEGSALNDGLHRTPASDLQDESFDGTIHLLAIPRALIELADEIESWCESNSALASEGYKSESFGGYSYTRPDAVQGDSDAAPWQRQFGARLRPYRKLSRDWT